MRFMVIVKASKESEAGAVPSTELLTEMGKYNQQLIDAGVMLTGEGLLQSAKGARVRFNGKGNTSVTKGPFAETESLVAGYWVWKLNSLDEAIAWLKKAPFNEGEVEIRQIASMEDFGENFTPELQEQEKKMSEQIASYAN
jgi:hypothetical protein